MTGRSAEKNMSSSIEALSKRLSELEMALVRGPFPSKPVLAYKGTIELKLDEGEYAYEVNDKDYLGFYEGTLKLSERGSDKVNKLLREKARSVSEGLKKIYDSISTRIFYTFPCDYGLELRIHGEDTGLISFEYVKERVDIGDRKLDNGKLVKEVYSHIHWNEEPRIALKFKVFSMDQERLERVVYFLEDFIVLDAYKNNAESFKKIFSGLGDETREKKLREIIHSCIKNEALEIWLSGEYPELSKRIAMEVMKDEK